ncbi:hypothetical protein K501DRAFT_262892 [Backusella circina FSU 941]|nr:hypothetical protein K501DRAFT_262892 [Backusella circina FSU 941]
MVVEKTVKNASENDEWNEERKKKYRKMKRKLIEFIAKQKDAQTALDKANRRIQTLEKKNRQLLKLKAEKDNNKDSNKEHGGGDAMDISQDDEDIELGDIKLEDDDEEIDQLADDDDDDDDDDDEEEGSDVITAPVPKKRSARRRRVPIPRDQDGKVILPFQIASLNVITLGKIESDRAAFHNERYIWPIGYTVERTYMSMTDPSNQTTYTCKVEDGQDAPLFTIQAQDAPDQVLSARTATGVWALVIKRANEIRHKESANAISGPEYYGFAHPLVIEMIEELEGVNDCDRYVRRHE